MFPLHQSFSTPQKSVPIEEKEDDSEEKIDCVRKFLSPLLLENTYMRFITVFTFHEKHLTIQLLREDVRLVSRRNTCPPIKRYHQNLLTSKTVVSWSVYR